MQYTFLHPLSLRPTYVPGVLLDTVLRQRKVLRKYHRTRAKDPDCQGDEKAVMDAWEASDFDPVPLSAAEYFALMAAVGGYSLKGWEEDEIYIEKRELYNLAAVRRDDRGKLFSCDRTRLMDGLISLATTNRPILTERYDLESGKTVTFIAFKPLLEVKTAEGEIPDLKCEEAGWVPDQKQIVSAPEIWLRLHPMLQVGIGTDQPGVVSMGDSEISDPKGSYYVRLPMNPSAAIWQYQRETDDAGRLNEQQYRILLLLAKQRNRNYEIGRQRLIEQLCLERIKQSRGSAHTTKLIDDDLIPLAIHAGYIVGCPDVGETVTGHPKYTFELSAELQQSRMGERKRKQGGASAKSIVQE